MRDKKRKWQRRFIKNVFESSLDKKKYFSKIMLNDVNLINDKNKYLPKYLFKYYSPTSENILTIKSQRLWLSHPKSFNDPFDCNIGYDSENYDKSCLIKFIKENGYVKESNSEEGFTLDDENRILRSRLGDYYSMYNSLENYSDAKRKILESKNKEFQKKVWEALYTKQQHIDYKIEKLKNINIRVACFSELERYDEFPNQIVMWSHYADNHKGFCIEFDLEFLKKDIVLSLKDPDFYHESKNEYLSERNVAIIKAGLFPIEYTSNRINIPVTKLNKINIDPSGNITYDSNFDELFYKAFVVKSANWNYEKEWRIIVDGQISDYYDNRIPFPYIKTIYLGCKANKELISTMISIGDEIGAEVVILKMDGKKFKLESTGTWSYKYESDKRQWNNPYYFE
jgi:hypothetical protein